MPLKIEDGRNARKRVVYVISITYTDCEEKLTILLWMTVEGLLELI